MEGTDQEKLQQLTTELEKVKADNSQLWAIVRAYFMNKTPEKGLKLQLGGKTWATLIGLLVINGWNFVSKLFFE